jgi:outer membrane immunogenic protein
MKILSGILGLALASAVAIVPANAADMYRAPEAGGYKDAPAYVGVNWSGAYLGGHVGGVSASDKVTDLEGYGFFPSLTNKASGVFGGGQLGYNWQRGNIVFGVEADLGIMGINHTVTERISASIKDNYYADVTGRLGYAFGSALVYAKGGVAYFNGEAKVVNPGRTFTAAQDFTGWTVGGGLEYALSPAWSVKGEYQHFDFGTADSAIYGCCKGGAMYNFHYAHGLPADAVSAGVNYHISSGYEPLK